MMIAGGAFILGGLTMGVAAGMHGRNDDTNRYEGMMGHHANERTDTTRGSVTDTSRPEGMMGEDGMGVSSMHTMHMMISSEREFLQEMIPHHEEAVATAKEVVARGGSTPEIKTLAERIIAEQEKEIADMKTWFKDWYSVDYSADGKYQPMMRPLTNLSGAALDKVFLADMIMHHRGALMMAGSVTSHIEHPEMSTLVGNIKTTQNAEITEMQNLLKTLQ